MIFYSNISKYSYDFENLLKIFSTKDKVKITADPVDTADFYVSIIHGDTFHLKVSENGIVYIDASYEIKDYSIKNQMKGILYDFLSDHFNKTSPWGILVGIRPVKIVHEALDSGKSVEDIRYMMEHELRVSKDKVDLTIEIAQRERPHLYPLDSKVLSLYICIPFCPTRCLYCSFPSNSTEKKKHCIEPYVAALKKEIDAMGTYISNSDYTVDCIYFGGGTPTSLSADQIEAIMKTLNQYFDLKSLKEFTFEAGRPDTITEEKLSILKLFHVDRICLNPQTFNDDTLVKIGRQHNTLQILDTYDLIQSFDFKVVNMDIILGLIDEDMSHIQNTIEGLKKLRPQNITVHTLSIKRSSRLNQHLEDFTLKEDPVEDYMSLIKAELATIGYKPYYMYRQKNILANLENTGYTMPGYESLYNMRIMEEKHTIVALGAGAVSKFVRPEINQFNRCANTKGLEDYIERIDEMIDKKITHLKNLSEGN